MSDYRLIAFDMDGTLLNSRKVIPEENLCAIKKATDAGKIVILSTGRGLSQLEDYICLIPKLRYVNCLSGACVYDLLSKREVYSNYLSKEIALKIVDEICELDVMIEFLTERHFVQRDKVEQMEKYGMGVYKDFYRKEAEKIEDIISWYRKNPFSTGKLNIYHRTVKDREKTNEIIKKCQFGVTFAYAEETSIEITAKNVDKGSGLENLCENLGINIKDTVVVGDADNDIGIFKKAGFRIAMGNANSNIKALSDVIVPDCDNGGCVVAIEKYFL